ncbi:recombinase family protein [Emcibacter sp. SYSU 3D8]|uniref:recombinase family protein n=1 Tax=Emcibacter sp. SYSU 3D8 TaxID=3133969 RepID=UPI0031FECB50
MATSARARRKPPENDQANLAAVYLRVSTEHQKYSTEFQAVEIAKYAQTAGLAIIRTYTDEARSGLNIRGRPGLQRLIFDVGSGHAPFGVILVYDVSRWGRFQDTDESAHYEFLCRTMGIRVVYCAEPFQDDGSPLTLLVKNIKRVMAAEYSRELSAKVFAAKRRQALRGVHTGGPPIYGLRRLLVSQNGEPKGLLAPGEYRSIKSDCVHLVHGAQEEVDTVRWIFAALVEEGLTQKQIVDVLNERGCRHPSGKPWHRSMICKILDNEKYAGVSVWNRASYKLKGPRVANERHDWVRVPAAIEPMISEELFRRAQDCRRERRSRTDPTLMLNGLRALLREQGHLSIEIIDGCPAIPCADTYARIFGGLLKAYRLVGYSPRRNYRTHEADLRRVARQRELLRKIAARVRECGISCDLQSGMKRLLVSDEVTIITKVLPPVEASSGQVLWYCARIPKGGDIYIVARELPEAPGAEDYYVVPACKMPRPPFNMARDSGPIPQVFHATSLDRTVALLARKPLSEV